MTIPHLSTIDPLEIVVLNNFTGSTWIIRETGGSEGVLPFRIMRATRSYDGKWQAAMGKYSKSIYNINVPLRELAPDEVLSLYLEGYIT